MRTVESQGWGVDVSVEPMKSKWLDGKWEAKGALENPLCVRGVSSEDPGLEMQLRWACCEATPLKRLPRKLPLPEM